MFYALKENIRFLGKLECPWDDFKNKKNKNRTNAQNEIWFAEVDQEAMQGPISKNQACQFKILIKFKSGTQV